ncbi:UDP-glucuronate:xylan alpha-glucuronosyltransferase 2 [Typha angustifolia]|uniref:UDP-glucuronate:xylan alpha-glucuronosyltransferase 2 n=1 Tax=Typha angustifolia TaxID=59011 RepID=UPI003C30645C
MGLRGGEMFKGSSTSPSRAIVVRINVAFLVFFLAAYIAILLLQPSSLFDNNAASLVRCTFRNCAPAVSKMRNEKRIAKERAPRFLRGDERIGLVNMGEDELAGWGVEKGRRTTRIEFEQASGNFEWKDLFPEWIDEEEEIEGPSCPDIPMPDLSRYEAVDVVVAKLPCRRPEKGWARDVARLQVHLVAANLAVRKGRRDRRGAVKVVFLSPCEPMMELFRCDDLAAREGDWWVYETPAERLEDKVRLPLGSCNLALPLWGEGINEVFDVSKLAAPASRRPRREAYATVLHSSDAYLCGAIMLAQSIRRTGSTRDLVLLHDKSIRRRQLQALVAAGWTLREIKRIRNPRAKKYTYNEYNYSKFRLWQLTDYDKVVFVDADILVLRNLDILFRFPQISATGNDGVIFNSGVMVIEPSNCTFHALMMRRRDIVSYNGGDQGFLNEVFVWWHRLPRRVNYLKNFWANTTAERSLKDHLYGADPPKVYAVHYLGLKPWLCYRDYDCNWNKDDQRVYASDAAHRTWWRLHDKMEEGLKALCLLSDERKKDLEWDRRDAEKMGYSDGHWRWNITDQRMSISPQIN